jgi:CTP:phosphocholine cytidylyltransferase-like protein
MAKVGFTNQQCNRVNIIASHYVLRRNKRLLHWKHILMSNAMISPSEIDLPFNASFAKFVTKTRTP